MVRILGATALALLASGCATQYQSMGFTGGHATAQAPGKLKRVVFSGNGYTTADLTQTYATYRCAEVAQASNKPYFIMYESLFAAAADRPSSTPRVGLVQNKPSSTVFMLMLDIPRPGRLETAAVLRELGPIVNGAAAQSTAHGGAQ